MKMNQDCSRKRREKIVSDHPLLFRYRAYFACGDGWLDIIEHLATKLEPMIAKFKRENPDILDDNLPFCSDVKEKYGALRFNMWTSTNEMEQAIGETEETSLRTCETCGNPGELKSTPANWLFVACEKCYTILSLNHQ